LSPGNDAAPETLGNNIFDFLQSELAIPVLIQNAKGSLSVLGREQAVEVLHSDKVPAIQG
jgi:hypothetical protein